MKKRNWNTIFLGGIFFCTALITLPQAVGMVGKIVEEIRYALRSFTGPEEPAPPAAAVYTPPAPNNESLKELLEEQIVQDAAWIKRQNQAIKDCWQSPKKQPTKALAKLTSDVCERMQESLLSAEKLVRQNRNALAAQ